MKRGSCVRNVEAQSMAFVRAHTSIPVPRPRETLLDTKGNVYIIMEFINAPELRWHDLSEKQQESVIDQMERYLKELRSIKPPTGTCVEAVDGGKKQRYSSTCFI
jgi:aminoglycoside phosphotransferase (APT) family kinase protein